MCYWMKGLTAGAEQKYYKNKKGKNKDTVRAICLKKCKIKSRKRKK